MFVWFWGLEFLFVCLFQGISVTCNYYIQFFSILLVPDGGKGKCRHFFFIWLHFPFHTIIMRRWKFSLWVSIPWGFQNRLNKTLIIWLPLSKLLLKKGRGSYCTVRRICPGIAAFEITYLGTLRGTTASICWCLWVNLSFEICWEERDMRRYQQHLLLCRAWPA